MEQEQLITFLNKKSKEYNKEFFIENDPISVPHRFTLMQDIEIAEYFPGETGKPSSKNP